ncbi:MAG: SAM-dependent methyltransferase [Casimicrobiaceae bacterium]
MADSSLQAVNVAMRGGGYYSAVTKGAKDVIDSATPLVLDAICRLPDADVTTPFTLADMGCADGGTSLDMVWRAINAVRERWPQRSICVVYTDQPRNDYNSLFRIIHGLTSLPSYLDEVEDVHVLASAASFYRQMLPAGTLDLGFSATAMHWLSRKPCDLTNHVHAACASGAELATFAEQGMRDWETILLQRARELKPNGRLVLVNFCKDDAGGYISRVNMFDTVNALWQRFATEGVISDEEYVRMTLPQYYRTVEEFTRPLIDTASSVYRAGLRLEQCETRTISCPFTAALREHGDAIRFAREAAPSLRSWSESTFLAALSPDRSTEEGQEIIERYYDTYEALLQENPTQYRGDYVEAYLTIAKTGV